MGLGTEVDPHSEGDPKASGDLNGVVSNRARPKMETEEDLTPKSSRPERRLDIDSGVEDQPRIL